MTHISGTVYAERRGDNLRIVDGFWTDEIQLAAADVPKLIQEICKLYGMQLEVVNG